MKPVIIEVSLNGPAKEHGNPNIPHTPELIAKDAIACLDAGASIIHNHIDRMVSGKECSDRYLEAYRPILAAHPDAILVPGVAGSVGARSAEVGFSHIKALSEEGVRMCIADPGSLNFPRGDADDGTPIADDLTYINTYRDTKVFMDLLRECRVGPSISVFEPGFLRATLAYHKAGKLPAGAFVKLYVGGDYNPFSRKRSNATFGLPPTRKALDAYLEMLEGTDIPWSVAVIGGDVIGSGLAQYALELGGNVRVGVEDYGGERKPSNLELLGELKALIAKVGRPIADQKTSAKMLNMPR